MEIAPFYLLTLLAGILAAIYLVVVMRRRRR
jgi:uncharacterized membrane protein